MRRCSLEKYYGGTVNYVIDVIMRNLITASHASNTKTYLFKGAQLRNNERDEKKAKLSAGFEPKAYRRENTHIASPTKQVKDFSFSN